MQLTDRINRIQISPTAAVIAEADKLKSRGVDVADFGPGEPDFPTPDHIKNAAIKAIEENKSKYTPTGGIMPLREAICAWHKRELGSSYEPKECMVSVGGKHSIFNVMSVLIQRGDEVIIPAPYWVSFPDIVKYAGGTPVYVQTKPEEGFSAAGSKENVIIVGSVSKTFAMTGWRIGYTLAPEALVQALIKLQSQSTSNPTSIAQYAALEAMRGTMETVPVMLAEYARRRKRIVEGLRAIPGVTCEWPGGAFYAFPNISAHLSSSSGKPALAKTCTEIYKTLLEK